MKDRQNATLLAASVRSEAGRSALLPRGHTTHIVRALHSFVVPHIYPPDRRPPPARGSPLRGYTSHNVALCGLRRPRLSRPLLIRTSRSSGQWARQPGRHPSCQARSPLAFMQEWRGRKENNRRSTPLRCVSGKSLARHAREFGEKSWWQPSGESVMGTGGVPRVGALPPELPSKHRRVLLAPLETKCSGSRRQGGGGWGTPLKNVLPPKRNGTLERTAQQVKRI